MKPAQIVWAVLLVVYGLMVAVVLLALAGRARAEGLCGLTPAERNGAALALGLTAYDWAQTRVKVARRPHRQTSITVTETGDGTLTSTRSSATDPPREGNPLLGERPTPAAVNAYFAGVTLAGLALTCLLPSEGRGAWLGFWVGLEAQAVIGNHWAGIRVAGSF